MVKHPTYRELKKKITLLQEELAKKEADQTTLRINQKRLKSLWKLASMTNSAFKTVCDTLLEEIVLMSESQYGFFGFINDDETRMQIFSWSEAVFEAFCPYVHFVKKSEMIRDIGSVLMFTCKNTHRQMSATVSVPTAWTNIILKNIRIFSKEICNAYL